MSNPLDHFAPLLDADVMALALQQHLPECAAGEWQVTGCDIEHPRYKTYIHKENLDRSFLSLVYHLRGKHPSSNAIEKRILYARAYLGERSRQVFEAARSVRDPNGRNGAIYLSDLGIVGWRFPDDPSIPWLTELMNTNQAAALIPVNNSCYTEGCDRLMDIEVVNYRPEIRCTARYRLRSPVTLKEDTIYGKIYADRYGQEIHENLLALRSQPQQADAFVIPEPLGYDPSRHTLWLQGLHGMPLKTALFNSRPDKLMTDLGKGLAAFHELSLQRLHVITPEQHLHEWSKKSRKLAHAYADTSLTLRSLLCDLEQNCPAPGEVGLIHGDFHIDQLAVLEQGRLALFDFDELALGDPLQDVANFAADLYNHNLPTADTDRLIETLFTAYRLAKPGRADANRFFWHLRGQLLTRAYRTHIQQRTDTEQRVAQLIALARRPWPHDF